MGFAFNCQYRINFNSVSMFSYKELPEVDFNFETNRYSRGTCAAGIGGLGISDEPPTNNFNKKVLKSR